MRYTYNDAYFEGWVLVDESDLFFRTYVFETTGPAYSFSGFAAPVNPDALNIAKAGQTIPLKFRVTNAAGNPVSGLTLADVTLGSVTMTCNGATGTPDELDFYTTSKSGWQDQGDGYYQYNWTTQKTWSGTCRQLQVDLGDGVIHTVDFQFKK